jgi:hypothetical protein
MSNKVSHVQETWVIFSFAVIFLQKCSNYDFCGSMYQSSKPYLVILVMCEIVNLILKLLRNRFESFDFNVSFQKYLVCLFLVKRFVWESF